MNATQLNTMREHIEQLPKFNQVEILRILTQHKVTINENKNGIHINLTELPIPILNELEQYLRYVSDQEQYLQLANQKQEQYKTNLNNETS